MDINPINWLIDQFTIVDSMKPEDYEILKNSVEEIEDPRNQKYLAALRRNVLDDCDIGAISQNLLGLANSNQADSESRLRLVLYELNMKREYVFNELWVRFSAILD